MSWLNDLIGGLPVNPVLRERLALAEEKMNAVEGEKNRLQNENRDLKKQIDEMKRQILATTPTDEFVENRGALFRRNKKGGFDPDAYCPDCRVPMISVGKVLPFRCGKCGNEVQFTGREIAANTPRT